MNGPTTMGTTYRNIDALIEALQRIHGIATGVTPTEDAVTALLEIEGYARVALAKAGLT
jgi:hypothetical protein